MYPLIPNRYFRPGLVALAFALALLGAPRPAMAAEPIGKVSRAVQTVTIGKGQATFGDDVFIGDEFAVGRYGTLTLQFTDESTLILTPGSRARITALDQERPRDRHMSFFVIQLNGSYRWIAETPLSQGSIEYIEDLSVFTPPGEVNIAVKPAAPKQAPPEISQETIAPTGEPVAPVESPATAASPGPEVSPVDSPSERQEQNTGAVARQPARSAQKQPEPAPKPSVAPSPKPTPESAVKSTPKPAPKPAKVEAPKPQEKPAAAQANKKPQAAPAAPIPVAADSKPAAADKPVSESPVTETTAPSNEKPAEPGSDAPSKPAEVKPAAPSEPVQTENAPPAIPEAETAEEAAVDATPAPDNATGIADDTSAENNTVETKAEMPAQEENEAPATEEQPVAPNE